MKRVYVSEEDFLREKAGFDTAIFSKIMKDHSFPLGKPVAYVQDPSVQIIRREITLEEYKKELRSGIPVDLIDQVYKIF